MSQSQKSGGVAAVLLGSLLAIWVGLTSGGKPDGNHSRSELASRMVACATPAAGLSYGSDRSAYLAAIYPGDKDANGHPNAQAFEMGSYQSSCMLFARACLAHSGITDPRIRGDYAPIVGTVETVLFNSARDAGALVMAQAGKRPDIEPGDVVVIGIGGSAPKDEKERAAWLVSWGGIAHGDVVTSVEGDIVRGVAGGQYDPQNSGKPTKIDNVTRTLYQAGDGRWWLGDRRINYIIKARLWKFPAKVD
jgi:hypothetical protein